MKKMYTGWKAEVTPQTALWSFSKPLGLKKEDFAAATAAFTQTVTQFVAPFDLNRCERCNAAVREMVLANGCPMSMCPVCQSKAQEENEIQRKHYESGSSKQPKAFVYGLPAALIAGSVAGLAA